MSSNPIISIHVAGNFQMQAEDRRANRHYSLKVQAKISHLIEDETRGSSHGCLRSAFDTSLFDQFAKEREELQPEVIKGHIQRTLGMLHGRRHSELVDFRKLAPLDLKQISLEKSGTEEPSVIREREAEHPMQRMNSVQLLDSARGEVSLSDSTSILHHENFQKKSEKLSYPEILAYVESKKKEKTAVNTESFQVEVDFNFQYKKNYEIVRLLVAAQCTLGKVSDLFFSLVNKGSLKLDHLVTRKQLNSTNFEWKELIAEISSEWPTEAISADDIEESALSEETLLTDDLLHRFANQSVPLSEGHQLRQRGRRQGL
jgi:hypothetical protein